MFVGQMTFELTFLYKLVDIFILFLQMISITLIIQQTQRILKRIIKY